MHGRTFHALCSLAFALTALGGLLAAWTWPARADPGGLLLAALLSAGFAVAAWMEPRPSAQCRSCGGPRGEGLGFCASCGDARPAPTRA